MCQCPICAAAAYDLGDTIDCENCGKVSVEECNCVTLDIPGHDQSCPICISAARRAYMDIQSAQKVRREAEDEILRILQNLEMNTGLKVVGVALERANYMHEIQLSVWM